MRDTYPRYGGTPYALSGFFACLVVLAAATFAFGACGCARQPSSGQGAATDGEAATTDNQAVEPEASDEGAGQPSGEEATADETPAGEGEEAAAAAASPDEDAEPSWDDASTDRHGNVTAQALATLDGTQLQTLLQQQDYAWNTRNLAWLKEDGTAAVVVYDAKGKPIDQDAIGKLPAGISCEDASYRITTSRYNSVRRAYDALVGNVLDCEDFDLADESAVAVARVEGMGRCLVFVNLADDTAVVSVFGEKAVAAGLFDSLAEAELGSTIDAAFEALTGRLPGGQTE